MRIEPYCHHFEPYYAAVNHFAWCYPQDKKRPGSCLPGLFKEPYLAYMPQNLAYAYPQ